LRVSFHSFLFFWLYLHGPVRGSRRCREGQGRPPRFFSSSRMGPADSCNVIFENFDWWFIEKSVKIFPFSFCVTASSEESGNARSFFSNSTDKTTQLEKRKWEAVAAPALPLSLLDLREFCCPSPFFFSTSSPSPAGHVPGLASLSVGNRHNADDARFFPSLFFLCFFCLADAGGFPFFFYPLDCCRETELQRMP